MPALFSLKNIAILTVALSIFVQIGFAVGVFGPAWLSPILTLPALAAVTWLWRSAEHRNAETQAFNELVI